MSELKDLCGAEEHHCDGCLRPDETKAACRELHRVAYQFTKAALASTDLPAIAGLIEILGSMALDLAVAATADPLKAVLLIRQITTDRIQEIIERAHVAPPTESAAKPVVH